MKSGLREVFIVSACRTPIGKFGGAFKTLTASSLGACSIAEVLKRATLPKESVDEVLMGNVIQAGQGQNPARQAAIKAGLPNAVPCTTINMVCGSGLKSIVMATQSIMLGDSDCCIAGGMESMSNVPYALSRNTSSLGHLALKDLLLCDGLTDAFDGRQMAQMCERFRERYAIMREQQDMFALRSQKYYDTAYKAGKFVEEINPVEVTSHKETKQVAIDEHPRPDTTIEKLNGLSPVFESNGSITAGNASGICDGAAALLLASQSKIEELGLPILGKVISWASAAREPELFGIAPAKAVKLALERAKLTLVDIDLIEANEAFAIQVLALSKEIGWNLEKVNVNGGAIAMGHPIGASGTRIVTTLLYEMKRRKSRYGLATLCCGGGMGIAMVIQGISH